MAKNREKVNLMFERLNNINYRTWSVRMKMLLIKENLWKYIDSESANDPEKSLKALSHIVLMVDNDQLVLLASANSGKEAWKILADHHLNKSTGYKARLIKKLFKMELQKGETMQKHLQRMFAIIDELKNADVNFEDTLIVSAMLSSLGNDYEDLVVALEAWKDNELTVSVLKSKLLDEYER